MKIILIILLSFSIPVFCENNADKKETVPEKPKNSLTIKSSRFVTKEKERYLLPKWSFDDKFIAFTNDKKRGLWILKIADNSMVNPVKENENVLWFKWNEKNEIIIPRDKDNSITVSIHFSSTDDTKVQYSFKDGEVFEKEGSIYFKSSEGKESLISISGREPVLENEIIIFRVGEESLNLFVQYDGIKKIVMKKDEKTKRYFILDMWAISPDGRYIVYSDYPLEKDGSNSKYDLFIRDLSTAEKFQLTDTPDISEVHPDFSSDGKKIACVDVVSGRICIIELQ